MQIPQTPIKPMLKTLTIILSAIFSISQFGCKSAAKPKETSQKEFEGVITYHEVEFINYPDGKSFLNDTVQLFYSHGNYVGIHSEKSAKFHVVKDYYLESKPLRLFLYNTSDTLHQLNLNFPVQKLDGFKVKKINDKILSRDCENIEVNVSYPQKDSTTYTDFNFIISRGYLKIDKQHFKNWNLGFFNKIADETGVFYLRLKAVHFDSTHKNALSAKIYDVISVKEQPVDPKIFEIDTTMIKWAN